MLAPRWRKVFRDLWSNKTRTILVLLSIAVGVTAIGMVRRALLIAACRQLMPRCNRRMG